MLHMLLMFMYIADYWIYRDDDDDVEWIGNSSTVSRSSILQSYDLLMVRCTLTTIHMNVLYKDGYIMIHALENDDKWFEVYEGDM